MAKKGPFTFNLFQGKVKIAEKTVQDIDEAEDFISTLKKKYS